MIGYRPRSVSALAFALVSIAIGYSPAFAEPIRERSLAPDHGALAGPPVMAIVSINEQRISLYDAQGNAMRARTSSGASGYETPVGIYSILQKNKDHYSNVYDDAAMPFMQRITWSGVALHEGQLPGYPASHGCVRLPGTYAEQIFPLTKIGMRVIVARDNVAPVDISHPLLMKPSPVSTLVVATPTAYEVEDRIEKGPRPFLPDLSKWPERQAEMTELQSVVEEKNAAAELTKAPVQDLKELVADQTKQRAAAVKVMRAAEKLKAKADEKSATAGRELTYATDPARAKPLETAKAKAQASVLSATERLEKAIAAVQAATSERARLKAERSERAAERAKQTAVAAVARVERDLIAFNLPARYKKQQVAAEKANAASAVAAQKLSVATANLQSADASLKDAEQQLATAVATMDAATRAATEARRKTLPVSVFISLKSQRLYIRQGHEPVIDVPVMISEPDRPIGTYVFTAVDYAQGGNDLRWTAVSLARRPGGAVARLSSKSRQMDDSGSEPFHTDSAAATAALDRLVIPDEVKDRIQASMWPGSSLIVSDEPLHKETNNATDFVVLISGELQGGIKRRPKPAPVRQFYDNPSMFDQDYDVVYDRYGRKMRIQRKKTFFNWW